MKAIPHSSYWLFSLVAAVGCGVDLWTKHSLFAWLGPPGGRTHWLIEPYLGFQTSLNRGALWGIGQGQVWVFAALSIVAAVGIAFWLFVMGEARDRLLTFALALVTGGILGNLYDRLGLWDHPHIAAPDRHAVRDWILFTYNSFVWPNFNIADSLLVCGAALLAFHAIRNPATRADPAHVQTPAA